MADTFKFYLNFLSDDSIGKFEISEPFGWDGSSYTVIQDKERYGRDVRFGNKEVSLKFVAAVFEPRENPITLPNGQTIYHLSHGFEYLQQYYKTYGFESEIQFSVEKDEIEFILGNILIVDTDLSTFFECKVREHSAIAEIKRNESTKIDLFSDKDINLNTITPVSTVNMLLKAKPVYQFSEWKSNGNQAAGFSRTGGNVFGTAQITTREGANNCNIQLKYGVEDSLSYISNAYTIVPQTGAIMPNNGNNFTYIEAQEELTNVSIKVSELVAWTNQLKNNSGGTTVTAGSGSVRFLVVTGVDYTAPRRIDVLYQKNFGNVANTAIEYLPTDFTLNIPLILRGERVYIFLECNSSATLTGGFDSSAYYRVNAIMENAKITIEGTSTAIDSVVKVVKYYDVLKQIPYAINGLPIYAPRFASGGEFDNQMATTGKLIRGFDDKPFYVTFKDVYSDLAEVNCDYQVNETEVYIGSYADFYPDKEIGAFLTDPDTGFSSEMSERYSLKGFNFKYENYEKDRDEKNTVDGVHTEAEFLLPNKQVENIKDVKISLRRDPYGIEKDRRLAISTGSGSTALDDDDKITLIDAVELTPGTFGGFTNYLQMRILGTDLQILNSSGSETGSFSWDKLGFNVGDYFEITEGENVGVYSVTTLEPTVITLSGGSPTFEGLAVITVTYMYNNVLYKNRTNEGFTPDLGGLIEGIESPDNFSNLRYHIKSTILQHWGSFLKTALKYKPLGTFINTFWKNNGELKTQFMGGEIYKDNDNEAVARFPDAILSPEAVSAKLIISYADAVDVFSKMRTINSDNSIGGYIRVADPNGRVVKKYLTKADYVPNDSIMDSAGEVKNESDYLTITSSAGLVTIQEVGYDSVSKDEIDYQINGDYIVLFDANSIPLCNPVKYDLVKVNGNVPESVIELSDMLGAL